MSLIDMYVRYKYTGKIHKIGTDPHDSIWVSSEGIVHYMNLQNGDGASGDGFSDQDGYAFVPSDCGEVDDGDRYRMFVCGNLKDYSDDELRHDLKLADEFIKRARGRDEKIRRQDT